MSQSKHTPGPWVMSRYGSFETHVRALNADTGRIVASTWTRNANTRRKAGEDREAFYERARAAELTKSRENEANARLIAAAPDMYSDGRFLLDRLEDFERGLSDDEFFREWAGHVAPAISRFRAALSRAQGEPS